MEAFRSRLHCTQNFPGFDRYFPHSCLICLTATEFFLPLPNVIDSYQILSTSTVFSRRKTSIFSRHFPTFLPPNSYVLFRYIPSTFPDLHPPIQPPRICFPSGPAGSVERCFPPPAACRERPNFRTESPNSAAELPKSDRNCHRITEILPSATEFCRQLLNFADRITEFSRQLPNFADRITEFC